LVYFQFYNQSYLVDQYSGTGRRLIEKAMRHWESETCIKFVKRTQQADYLHIYQGNGYYF